MENFANRTSLIGPKIHLRYLAGDTMQLQAQNEECPALLSERCSAGALTKPPSPPHPLHVKAVYSSEAKGPSSFSTASFLIPYGIMLAVEGIPLYYMELCIGQKMRKGAVGVWNDISPYLGGVGIASAVVCFLVSLYYNVIIAWCVFYFVTSFQSDLPWSKCPTEEVTLGNVTRVQPVRECSLTRPTAYFWYRTTLQTSSGIEDGGGMNWKLFACLACTWFLVWLCMMKGIKVTGKV